MKSIENRSKSIVLCFFMLLFSGLTKLQAQTFENLNYLSGYNTKTYFSEGSKKQAVTMAARCDSVISFYKSLIDFEPTVTLLVLAPADWSKYTNFPVYGMPHYNDAQTLIVASDDNAFWKSFIPLVDQLPTKFSQQISTTYSSENGSLTMRSFFDLLAIHELGHAFHIQGKLTVQRKWMGELFANMLLHTYIAEKEPDLLPALTIFPKMVVSSSNKEELKYTSLEELESNYDILGQQYPQNYGWYQCRWHMAAGNIYDVGGITTFQNLWQALKNQKEPLDNKAFAALLAKVHQSVADVQLKWDK
tara:strand:+ start:99761 stop:100672 length:912 start_codon:yes stop_codon:yes gene_type:complete